MRPIIKIIDKITVICGTLAAPLPFLAALAICYEIVMRKFFDLPTVWSSELTLMLCGTCYLLGDALNIKNDSHVRVDILYHNFKPRARAAVDCLTFLFFALYIVVMLLVIWPYMMQSVALNEHSQTAWNPPLWLMKVVMFVGFCLVLMQGLAKFVRNLYLVVRGVEL